MTKTLFEQYEKGYSPPSLQRKYSLSYVQGYELAQDFKRLQEKKQKVIALIKDGRFVEALQELEK